ncbi:hypothetical protein G3569_12465 [Aliifodinibius halophilus]|uniref:Uncharacterized protein n=2 Tax=Fodinibius halophilus TaxID=1736908 RepID=A0A6M1T746_9BACT|nr:hypothetical protein [Fodinibius halophilus]
MPNHFHAIVEITDPDKTVEVDPPVNRGKGGSQDRGGYADPPQPDSSQSGPSQPDSAQSDSSQPAINPENEGADPRISPERNERLKPDFEPRQASIPKIVQWLKTMTTNEYIKGVKKDQFPPFDRRLWQRNYYDHIIRDKGSLERIRYYIIQNPSQWQEDQNNPGNV